MNAPQNKYLCLNILGFKKPGISGQDYRDYMIHTHAPLVAGLMEKYGITQWSMTHTSEESALLLRQIANDAQFAHAAPYDCVVQIVFPDMACFVRLKADPHFESAARADHEQFADTTRSQMLLGWFTPLLQEGRLLVLVDEAPGAGPMHAEETKGEGEGGGEEEEGGNVTGDLEEKEGFTGHEGGNL